MLLVAGFSLPWVPIVAIKNLSHVPGFLNYVPFAGCLLIVIFFGVLLLTHAIAIAVAIVGTIVWRPPRISEEWNPPANGWDRAWWIGAMVLGVIELGSIIFVAGTLIPRSPR